MGANTLIEAVRCGDTDSASALIAAGHEVDARDTVHGWAPLNYAAGRGQLDMITLLIEAGADIVSKGQDNRTPYDIALAADQLEAARYLAKCMDATGSARPSRGYCRAYKMRDLHAFERLSDTAKAIDAAATVFVHQDCSVTKSMFHGEDVVPIDVTPEWCDFCARALNFRAPTDFEIVAQARSPAS